MMFEAQPKPMFGEINWKIRKGENSELIIPVKVIQEIHIFIFLTFDVLFIMFQDDDINRIQNYEAHPLQEVEYDIDKDNDSVDSTRISKN